MCVIYFHNSKLFVIKIINLMLSDIVSFIMINESIKYRWIYSWQENVFDYDLYPFKRYFVTFNNKMNGVNELCIELVILINITYYYVMST